ncbi:MAG: iron dependent repressor, metal binding and dimerization domain protein, partial [Planctomycetaceae bacterium]
GFFLISLLAGRQQGLIRRWRRQSRTRRRIGRDHLLRAMFEVVESRQGEVQLAIEQLAEGTVTQEELARCRSWSTLRVGRLLDRSFRRGDVRLDASGGWCLTRTGAREASRAVRNHRLWEMFLIRSADIAPSHVDRDADFIEHVLDPEVIEELESMLSERDPRFIPPSPHPIEPLATRQIR